MQLRVMPDPLGKVGVAIATSGPGATNLVTGIADAQIDSTPMVCITGQVASYLLGSDAFQETDIIGISTPVTKWNYQITKASEISEIISKAFFIAKTGRPGPVLIDITKDAQFDMIENFEYKKCENIRSYSPIPSINKSIISDAGKLINESKKPSYCLGSRCNTWEMQSLNLKILLKKLEYLQHGQFLVSRQFLRIINLMLEWLVCMEIMVQMF